MNVDRKKGKGRPMKGRIEGTEGIERTMSKVGMTRREVRNQVL